MLKITSISWTTKIKKITSVYALQNLHCQGRSNSKSHCNPWWMGHAFRGIGLFDPRRWEHHVVSKWPATSPPNDAAPCPSKTGTSNALLLKLRTLIIYRFCSGNNDNDQNLHNRTHACTVPCSLTFRHRASFILGQAFRFSPENTFYIFNQQIYFIIWYLLDRASLI
jgi:hypothetical protein